MKNLITETGLNFSTGQKLSSSDLNKINNKINELVEVMNIYLKTEININAEEGDLNREFRLSEVLETIPNERRSPGIKIRFKDAEDSGKWNEYIYTEQNTGDLYWKSLDNWQKSLGKIIDGGEW